MSKITQDVRPTNDPSYLGYSKEPDRIRPNTSLGTLFEGIGEAVGGVAATLDNENQAQITKDLYEGVDPIRNAQGVDTAIGVDGDLWGQGRQGTLQTEHRGGDGKFPTLNRPPNADAMDRSVATLTEAWRQGKVSDTAYYSRLEALSRQVRSRYPGYREVIDSKIQSITGVNPANALRKEVLQEYATAAAKQHEGQNKEEAFYNSNGEDLPPDFFERKNSGNPYAFDDVRKYVFEKKRERQEVNDIKSSLELRLKNKQATKEDVVDNIRDVVSTMSSRVFSDSALGSGWKNFEKTVMEAQKNGKDLTPEQRTQFEQQLTQYGAAYELNFETMMNDTKNGRSFRSMIGDETEVKKLKEGYMARWGVMKDMLLNGQYGLFGAALRDTEARQDATSRKLMKDNPFLEKLTALGKVPGGKEIVQGVIASRPNVLGPIIDSMLNNQAADRAAGNGSFTGQLEQLRQVKGKGTTNQFSTAIDEAVRGVTDPSSPDVRKNHAKALYGPAEVGTLEKFKPDDQVKVYTRMVNPQITQALKNDPEAFKMYSDWADRQFSSLLTTQMRMVKDTNANANLYNIQWDPKAKQFLPELTPAGQQMLADAKAGKPMAAGRNLIGIAGQPNYQTMMGRDWDVLTQLNDGIRGFGSVAEANGKSLDKEIMRKMDEVAPSAPKESFFDKAWNSIFGATQQEGSGTAEQKMQQRLQQRGTQPLPKPSKTSALIDVDGNDTGFELADLEGIVSPQDFFGSDVSVANLPAGMRNNNPGNIKDVGQKDAVGPSKNTDQGDPQAVYDSPLTGMTAAARLAYRKWNGGKTTVNDLIAGKGGWTPGNTRAAANIAASMNIGPGDEVNLDDPKQMKAFLRALITQEHGPESKRYKDDLIQAAVAKVLGTDA